MENVLRAQHRSEGHGLPRPCHEEDVAALAVNFTLDLEVTKLSPHVQRAVKSHPTGQPQGCSVVRVNYTLMEMERR